jgi:anti-sigma-K factor RskA
MSPDEREDQLDACGGNAAPYVLEALTHDESEVFRRHLESCAICREEVAALQTVASALPAAAPQLKAPSDLKRRVMRAVREQEQAGSPRARERPGRGLPRFGPALAGLAVAATVVVLLVVGVFVPGGLGGGARVIRAEVSAPGASALVRLEHGHAQLTISRLPQSGPGRVYEVWLKASGAPQPTDALFTVSSKGDATVGVPAVGHGVRELMVTSEPLGGSLHPTRTPLIVARLG